MPNLDPWLNKQNENDQQQQQQQQRRSSNTEAAIAGEESTKLVNHLLSIRSHNQKQIKPNCHPTYNEDHEKRIELIDWVLKKYKDDLLLKNKINQQQNEEHLIDNIIDELDNKRDVAINKKKKALLKDEMLRYRLEEDTLDYVLFIIRDFTGRYYN
jgi:hypothetical protein